MTISLYLEKLFFFYGWLPRPEDLAIREGMSINLQRQRLMTLILRSYRNLLSQKLVQSDWAKYVSVRNEIWTNSDRSQWIFHFKRAIKNCYLLRNMKPPGKISIDLDGIWMSLTYWPQSQHKWEELKILPVATSSSLSPVKELVKLTSINNWKQSTSPINLIHLSSQFLWNIAIRGQFLCNITRHAYAFLLRLNLDLLMKGELAHLLRFALFKFPSISFDPLNNWETGQHFQELL